MTINNNEIIINYLTSLSNLILNKYITHFSVNTDLNTDLNKYLNSIIIIKESSYITEKTILSLRNLLFDNNNLLDYTLYITYKDINIEITFIDDDYRSMMDRTSVHKFSISYSMFGVYYSDCKIEHETAKINNTDFINASIIEINKILLYIDKYYLDLSKCLLNKIILDLNTFIMIYDKLIYLNPSYKERLTINISIIIKNIINETSLNDSKIYINHRYNNLNNNSIGYSIDDNFYTYENHYKIFNAFKYGIQLYHIGLKNDLVSPLGRKLIDISIITNKSIISNYRLNYYDQNYKDYYITVKTMEEFLDYNFILRNNFIVPIS